MSGTIDAASVRALAALLEETGLSEIEYATDGLRIRVVRSRDAMVSALAAAVPLTSALPASGDSAASAPHPGTVRSPMVGTIYLSAEPGAPAFVAAGDTVKEGQTLLLIEAMKTFNEIKSPVAGTVRRILVENQQPVEFGEALMIVE